MNDRTSSRGPRARILGTGRYVPARVVSNEEIVVRLAEAGQPSSDAWIREHVGVLRRRWAADDEVTSDLAAKAGRAAIESAGLTVADLDMIIVATSTGDSPMPATAVHVQQKLGADLIPSFDVNAGFAGFLYALSVADQFVSSGTLKTVLVVGADLHSRALDPADRTTFPVLADGAGAVVVGPSDGSRGILSLRLNADGALSRLISVQAGGSAEPMSFDALRAKRHVLRMRGPELLQVSVRHLTTYSMQALKGAGLTSAELDWVVPHQANENIVRKISERIGYPRSKFVENLAETGNTGAASVPLALDEAVRDGRVLPGQTVLLCALGAGLAWGAGILRM